MSEVYYYKNEFTEIIAIRANHEKYSDGYGLPIKQ